MTGEPWWIAPYVERAVVAGERVATALSRIAQVLESDQARDATSQMDRAEGMNCMVCTHRATSHDGTGCTLVFGERCGCRRTYSQIVGSV